MPKSSYRHSTLSFLAGILLSAILLGFAECFFRLNFHYQWILPKSELPPLILSDFDHEQTESLKKQIQFHPVFQWNHPLYSPEPPLTNEELDSSQKGRVSCCIMDDYILYGGTYKSQVTTNITHRSVYTVSYTFDIHGRRRTPEPQNTFKNILIFGDSFTLGEGVNDDETTAFQLGILRPTTKVYNLGLAGGSPNQFLYETELDRPRRLTNIDTKIYSSILYVYMDHHLERLVARSSAKPWIYDQPFYSLENGSLTFRGSFRSREPLNTLYKFFESSRMVKHFNMTLPPRFTDKHFELFALTIKKASENLQSHFPRMSFHLVLFPGASHYYGPRIASVCRRMGISVLDYSRIDMHQATAGRTFLPLDGHPTPISHFALSMLLNKDLPPELNP